MKKGKNEFDEEPPKLKKGCYLSYAHYGNNRMCMTAECIGESCIECIRYIRFYERVEELETAGLPFGEATRRAKTEGYGEM